MKNPSGIILSLALIFLLASMTNAETFKPESYAEVDKAKLKALPEEYKNKKIWYESEYLGYDVTFPNYVEKSGYKAEKNFCLLVAPVSVPVMAEKIKETNELVLTLKKGSKIKVYGKIKKFSSEPERSAFPRYFLELDKIEVVGPPAPAEEISKEEIERIRAHKEKVRARRAAAADANDDVSPWRIDPPQDPQKR